MAYVIENPGRPEVQAIFVKAALKMGRIGLKTARHLTKTKRMAKAGEIRGVKYKRNESDKANEDMDASSKSNIRAETRSSDRH